MKKLFFAAAAVCAFFLSLPLAADTPRGHLVIIGGGGTTESIRQRIVDYTGGENGTLLTIGTAGGEKAMESAEKAAANYTKAGIGHAVPIDPTREECDDEKYVNKIMKGITGVYFCGGLQKRIVKTIGGTLLHKRIMELYMDGGLVCGTSAGAAIMSNPMISGKDLSGEKNKFVSVSSGRVDLTDGLGFVSNCIIDQHFLKRKRQNRLFSTILEHPRYMGIGIDEATSIVISNGFDAEVVGRSSVTVMQADREGIRTNSRGDFAGSFSLRFYIEGDTFRIPETI